MANAFDGSKLEHLIARHADRAGGLLPLLHDVQHAFGFVPNESVEQIARALHLSRAEVHGVVTYYSHFRSEPAGKVVVQMCRAEACQARGAVALIEHAERFLGCKMSSTRSDGAVTLEPVYCLGQCATGPNILIDERLHGRVDQHRLEQLIGSSVTSETVHA
jgi:formate dehydrogenase subunit gamma